jgi:uncharacterized Fe-S cluster-containing protein
MHNRHEQTPVHDYIAISTFAGSRDFDVPDYQAGELAKTIRAAERHEERFTEEQILEVLMKIGKRTPEDELNCGTCGYSTCREKAQAVLEGKANLFMCLPYLLAKTQSFSDTIVNNMPSGILVLNEAMEVQLINNAACRLFHITPKAILGDQVVRLLDPLPFLDAVSEKKNSYDKAVYLADYEKYVSQTVLYDQSYHAIICILRDVTEATVHKEHKEAIIRQTIAVADKVIEKQMRTVQEIASLLGESTAETKVALTKLKTSALADDADE